MWKSILAGHCPPSHTRFLLQARTNRLHTRSQMNRFFKDIPPQCPHCPEEIDNLEHRFLTCKNRSEDARLLKSRLARTLSKHSCFPWQNQQPQTIPDLRALLSHWPNQIIIGHSTTPSKCKLSATDPAGPDDGLLPNGAVDIPWFQKLNPFTTDEKIKAKPPPPTIRDIADGWKPPPPPPSHLT